MKWTSWCWLVLGLLCCGCAGSESTITGTVNLDGKPVAEGDIRFIPMEGTEGGDAGAAIRDGKYKIAAPELAEGKYRVRIRGYKQSGKFEPDPLGGPPIKGIVQIVPREYSGPVSKEVREIIRGANRFDFDLVTSATGE